jgi:hypothetical protein
LERREENSCRVIKNIGTFTNSELIKPFSKFPAFQNKIWYPQQQHKKAEALEDYSELSVYGGRLYMLMHNILT